MKRIIYPLLFLVCFHVSTAQIAYYDALAISKLLVKQPNGSMKLVNNATTRNALATILRNYTPPAIRGATNPTPSTIFTEFDNNKFIQPYFPVGGYSGGTAGTSILAAANNLGNFDVTTIADGIAKWMVSRTKEELNATFFQRFKKEIDKPQYEDFRILFPKTYSRLEDIGEQIYNYSVYLTDLQKDFTTDLAGVLENFPKVIDSEKYRTFFDENPELYALLHSSVYLFDCLKQGKHPSEIINDLPVTDYFGKVSNTTEMQNVKASIQTLQLVSQSFASTTAAEYWVPAESLLQLLDDKDAFRIYLGLIAQQADYIQFYVKTTTPATTPNLKDLMNAHATDFDQYDAFFRGLVYNIKDMQVAIKTVHDKKAVAEKIEADEYFQIYSAVLNTVEAAAKVRTLPCIRMKSFPDLDHYINGAKSLGNLYVDVKSKNYISVVLDLVTAYDNLIQPAIEKRKAKIDAIAKANAATDPMVQSYKYKFDLKNDNQAFAQLNKETKTGYYTKLVSGIMRYGSFMAAVSKAKNSDEVKAAIEAVALPVGSSSIKKTTAFTISLNTYVAPSFGAEYLKNNIPVRNANGEVLDNTGNVTTDVNKYTYKDTTYNSKTMGIYAPVGIGFNLAFTPKNGNGGSLSFFVPLIDLGAFVTYRFKDDTITLKESVKTRLKDIFAPGISVIYGIPKVPLSIGFSCNWAPALSAVYADKVGIRDSKGYRLHGFIGVDIPAVNLFASKGKHRKN